jgi:O26-antigen biosynthesis N-acetyl-L-fucosamine transferase
MNILLLSDSCVPNKTSVARMIDELAAEYTRQGHTVCVVTSSRNIKQPILATQHNGYQICYVKAGKYDHVGRISRAIAEITLPFTVYFRARKVIKNFSPDVIVWYSPTIFWGWLVHKVSALFKPTPFRYLIVRDIFPKWALDVGEISRSNPAYWIFRYAELLQYKVADQMGVQSPSDFSYFSSLSQSKNKLEQLWNWTKLTATPLPAQGQFRERLGLTDKVVFLYGGNMGVAQGMDRILKLAKSLAASSNAHFLLVGEGSERERLQRVVVDEKIVNVTILPPVAQDEFLQMLHEFDVGIVLLDPALRTHNVPGKLISYAAAGLPMLADMNDNDVLHLITKHEAALTSVGCDNALHQNAMRLLSNSALRQQIGSNGKKLAQSYFSVENTASTILAACDRYSKTQVKQVRAKFWQSAD